MIHCSEREIGVIACPGGEQFAHEIILHLKRISAKRFARRITNISERYDKPKNEIIETINLHQDITHTNMNINKVITGHRMPKFKIEANFYRFANGEMKTEMLSSIRGRDVYIVQDIANHSPLSFYQSKEKQVLTVNDHLFCLFVTVDAALQAGAGRVTIVLPLYPYSRQHRKKSREGLTAARFGQIMEYFGIARIITLDIHSKEIENCFNSLRLENLRASYQILLCLDKIIDLRSPDLIIVAPDTGAVERNKFYARTLGKPLGMIYKERDYSQVTRDAADSNITAMKLLGNVKGKTVFMCDDMIDTGGTIVKAVQYLKEMGAEKIICGVSLPLFNGQAIEHFDKAHEQGLLYRVIGTNAIFHDESLARKPWYMSANVSKLFASSIFRLHFNKSLSPILDCREQIAALIKKVT
jgi:ribose-phosphate pyrophosphokinase